MVDDEKVGGCARFNGCSTLPCYKCKRILKAKSCMGTHYSKFREQVFTRNHREIFQKKIWVWLHD